MKIILGLAVILFALLSLNCNSEMHTYPVAPDTTKVQGIQPDEQMVDGNIKVYSYSKGFHLTIVSIPDTIHYIYTPKSHTTFAQKAREGNFRYMINATYFSGPAKDAKHAGWLWIYGSYYEPRVEDKQLTHVVSIDRHRKTITYTYYKDFGTEFDKNCLEFQTGPMIIENSKLAETYINSSINGLRYAPRTMIASLDNKQIFFIISESYLDLITLGNHILKLSVFHGKKLDVINLDGGPSTAFYSKNYRKLNYNSEAVLPFMLAIN